MHTTQYTTSTHYRTSISTTQTTWQRRTTSPTNPKLFGIERPLPTWLTNTMIEQPLKCIKPTGLPLYSLKPINFVFPLRTLS
jgi:hypothetical protein